MPLKSEQMRTGRLRAVFAISAPLLILTVIAACGGASSEVEKGSSGLAKLDLRADIYYTGAFMPFLVGINKGIYEKHGIDLTVHEGKGSATTIQTTANGSDDLGYADGGAIIQAAGKGIPVVAVLGMLQKNPMAIAALPDSGISKPTDLNGKTGAFTPGSASELLWPAYAEATGIDADSVHFQKVDFDLRDQLMLEDKVDFTFGFINGNLTTVADQCKCDLNIFKYSDVGLIAPSAALLASESFIHENSELLSDFIDATVESFKYTADNLDEAIESFFAVAPNSSLSAQLVEQQWKESLPLIHTNATEDEPFGCMAKTDWNKAIALQERFADVDKGSVSAESIFTNKYNERC